MPDTLAAMKQPIVIFDPGVPELAVMTDLRPVFDVRTGALTTLERIAISPGITLAGLIVPEHLAELTRQDHPGVPVNDPGALPDRFTLVNGSWAHCTKPLPDLAPDQALTEPELDQQACPLVCANISRSQLAAVLAGEFSSLRVEQYQAEEHRQLIARPWHVRAMQDAVLLNDLKHIISTHLRADNQPVDVDMLPPLWIAPDASIHESVIFDSASGPIVVESGVTIRPGVIIVGPVYIGHSSTINEHALIKSNTALGPHCKVAGEVGGSIFQGFSNKSHAGHLGDSWVGSWVNLGADTVNSNLLNTYASVVCKALPNNRSERTNLTFLGSIIGDHVKTAIGTRIMTGSIIHTGAMHAATSPISGTISPFSWTTDAGTRPFRISKFIEIATTVMARRGIEPTQAYLQRLTEIHDNCHASL